MHEVLVKRLGGLSLPRKSVVRLTDRPDMTLDVYRGCKTTTTHTLNSNYSKLFRLNKDKGSVKRKKIILVPQIQYMTARDCAYTNII